MNSLPRISVIICSIDAGKFAQASQGYRQLLAEFPHEIIGIHDARSLAEGYNRGMQRATGDIFIFSHDDILILDRQFARKIVARLEEYDLLGFAGADRIIDGAWAMVDLPYLHGAIAHAPPGRQLLTLTLFGAQQWPVAANIKAIDGLCMIARRDVALNVGFDADTFDGFHLYDIDFSFSAHRAGYRVGVCCDIPLIHYSEGSFDAEQERFSRRFVEKHADHLDSAAYARDSTRKLLAASFSDPEALKRTWCEETFRRSTIAMLRRANLPVLMANEMPAVAAHDGDNRQTETVLESDASLPNRPETQPTESPTPPPEEAYQRWIAARTLTPDDLRQLLPVDGRSEITTTTFQILLQLPLGGDSLLADTLDSLAAQHTGNWRLDVITSLPAPAGIEEIPNIGWHEVAAGQPVDMAALVEAAAADWVLELPPGARLDSLYLWRIATEAARSPATQAFFVDDDCTDPAGQRQAPRFKPGCNPSRLLASDLAGPLCVRRPAYLASAAGAPPAGSPWFRQLLAIAEQHGWASIGHVADVLLTYPQAFPSDTEACLHALLDFLGRQAPGAEIVPVTGQAWNIRYPLPSPPPKVCIALLSQGQLDLLARCLNTILKLTHYPDYEILLVVDAMAGDSELDDWLSSDATAGVPGRIRVLRPSSPGNHATRCNQAMAASDADYVVLLREEAAIVQEQWLDELLRPLLQPAVVAVAPLLITPGKAEIWAAGCVLGLMGSRGYPEQQKITLGQPGYLEHASAPRDTSTLSSGCVLWRRADYLEAGGMDEAVFGDHQADADVFLKLRARQRRLLFQPASVVVFNGPESPTLDYDPAYKAQAAIAGERAEHELNARWGRAVAVDPLWNPNLSLTTTSLLPETKYRAQWQFLPSDRPRIFACPIPNGQGDYRITSPLKAARKLGLASQCVWMQSTKNPNYLTVPELLRLAPDTAIVQNYIFDRPLAALDRWHRAPGRPFTVYALDDLITGLDPSNPFFKNIPANARARLQYALDRCDRMVVSTDFLADRYSSFIRDIRVAPNCLEQEIWLPLRSQKRTGKRPRIGWAGGSTHHADLLLLREIIERTRHEADWVFFGMCPREVLPLLAEFHDTIAFEDYPAYLASLNFDIAVAPLAQTEFNRGKSNLRLLEYGILGIPVVCTDIDPYRDSPACRVPNIADAWVEALRARIHDADAREREGVAMRDWVCQNYLLENRVNDWLAAHLPD
ncbi:glycosyltransferase [Azonexus caeni]|jgi:GT2 family glycosyltransferase/glycosyltransferase involved in cell wall biosynthesis